MRLVATRAAALCRLSCRAVTEIAEESAETTRWVRVPIDNPLADWL
jgi:hypothetical protein